VGKLLTIVTLLALSSTAVAKPQSAGLWQPLQFLVGEWTAEGGGDPGQGSGSFSFRFDLDKKILIRQNRSDYPATKDRPAFSHGDLMVIYPDSQSGGFRAIYFDNEEHVIEYRVRVAAEGNVEFVSSPVDGSPRFRLTYAKSTDNALAVKFEVAPPGNPDTFKTYVEGRARPAHQSQ
jgi:hypothetical protein